MKFLRHLSVLFGVIVAIGLIQGCDKPASLSIAPASDPIDPTHGHLLHAQTNLPTIKVKIEDQELTAEICRQQTQIATGMMFRTNMPENTAMLFVFPDPEPRSFYMRNCFVPLSAAYISPRGEILQVIDMQPQDERGIPSESGDIQFVLEVPQGWFTRHLLGPGAFVRTERGSLMETFFEKPQQ